MIDTILQSGQLQSSLYSQIDFLLKSIVSVHWEIKSIFCNHPRDSEGRKMCLNSNCWLKMTYKYLLCDTRLFLSCSPGQSLSGKTAWGQRFSSLRKVWPMGLCWDTHTHTEQGNSTPAGCFQAVYSFNPLFVCCHHGYNKLLHCISCFQTTRKTTFDLATAPVSAWEDGKPGWIVALTALIWGGARVPER